MLNTIFLSGDKMQGGNFTGTVWVKQIMSADTAFDASIGNVIFEPKARSKWHKHPGGQTLLALDGVGYYQEKGKPLQILRQGDVVRCPPDVEHWHGASHDNWFVQLAITPEHPKGRVIWLHEVSEDEYQTGIAKQQETQSKPRELEKRHQHIVAISSFTTKGDLEQLKNALNDALNAGLTINEIKETLVHLYAYCGFPRSIQGLNTLMAVLETRKVQGITDETGKTASPIADDLSKYERGKKILEGLTGQPQITPPKSGYGAFSPEIDVFLKEHLFADIFGRDVLNYQDREVATITALVNLGGLEPMLKSHIGIALNIGMTEAQLLDVLSIIEATVGAKEADAGRKGLAEVMPLPVTSGNPIFDGWYADPEARIFNKTYWVYPTCSDKYDKQVYFDAFSSSDLVTWTKLPRILDTAAVKWAHRAMWAPSVVEKGGKYYYFFGANDIQSDAERGGIGVAVSDKPGGPFKDYLGKPLVDKFHNGAQPIDQFVFKDVNGQYYLLYGGWRHCNIAKLNADFTGFVPFEDGTVFREITPEGYVEGSFMFLRNGKYYFMWSEGGWTGPDYSVAYAMADSPFGPFQRIGKILQQDARIATGAGHHSVVQLPGKDEWYIFYHRRPLTETDGNSRQVCIEQMYFDEKGFIKPVVLTREGVGRMGMR